MNKIESVLACCTGAVTAIVSVTDKINLVSVLSSLVLGFVGAFGGWIFTKSMSLIIDKVQKAIGKIKKRNQKKIKNKK